MPGAETGASPPPDIVVVGTGATASVVIDHFVRRGRRVLVLERGRDEPYAPSTRERWWFEDVQHRDAGGRYFTRNGWDRGRSSFAGRPGLSSEEAGYDDLCVVENVNPELRFNYNMKLGYGGSSAVWSGRCWRFYPEDFALRSRFGYGSDWPVGAEAMAPYYDRAEALLEVSGDGGPNWPFGSNFRWPAFAPTELDRTLAALFGPDWRMVPTANAVRNTDPREGGCVGSKTCVQFCPNNALVRHYLKLVEPLRHNPLLDIRFDWMVTALEADAAGRIDRLRARHRDGSASVLDGLGGATLFLCANTIETLRILLNSERETGRPVANANGLLGRYFATHGATVAQVVMRDPLPTGRSRPSTAAMLDADFGRRRGESNATMIEFFSYNWRWGEPERALPALRRATGFWGRRLFEVAEVLARSTILSGICELELRYQNRVTLSSARDRWDMPLARVEFEPSERDLRTLDGLRSDLLALATHPQCEAVTNVGGGLNGNHPIGGYVAATKAEDGVVDAFGRSFDHANLYLAGGGVFNSTSAFNPTLTITANTLRMLDDPRLNA